MNAIEALKVYFPNAEGLVGPYGLLVGLAYLEENPATEAGRREAVMALIDSIAPLSETLSDDQLEQLKEVIICFFMFGSTLIVPHIVDKKKKEQVYERSIGTINASKAAAKDRAKAIAAEVWQADTANEYRLLDMAKVVKNELEREAFNDLPELNRIKEWLKPVAPEYARKGGRPSKPS